MARPSISRYFTALCLVLICFRVIFAESNSTFSFKSFGKDSNFESLLALYGGAKVANGGSSVEISTGRVACKEPIKLFDGNPKRMVSFSTSFSFSMLPGNGDGLAFFMIPIGFPVDVFDAGSFGLLINKKNRTVAVKFDTFMDEKYGDLYGSHVGIDIDSLVSVKATNVSSLNLVLNGGKKLQAWIDYQAGSRRLEVRLGRLGEIKPIVPLLSCPIDLSQVWKEGEVLVGLSASNANSLQTCNVYSWSFEVRHVPHWMHSEPVDPKALPEKTKALALPKRKDCLLQVLAALIFGMACGALGASLVLFLWTIFGNRRPVVPEEYAKPELPVEFESEKFNVVIDQAIKDGKK